MNPNQYNIFKDCLEKNVLEPATASKCALVHVRALKGGVELKEYSYREVHAKALRAVSCLQHSGFESGDRVVVRLSNSPDFVIAFLGCIGAGLIPIPTSPLLTRSELEFIVHDSGARLIITDPFLSSWQGASEPLPILFPSNFEKIDSAALPLRETRPDDPAYWLYTSGTQGVPKAVMHAHRSIPAHDGRVKLWQGIAPNDRVLNTSALNWSYALTCGWLDLWRHSVTSMIYEGDFRAETLACAVEESSATIFMSVPGIYRRLAGCGDLDLKFRNVRICLSAGEKLPEEIRDAFFKRTGIIIREGLGMTEHSVYLVQETGQPVVRGSCGRPAGDARVAVLREDLSEASSGEIGILASHRASPGLMLGYYNRSKEEGFRGDWFLSGDLAYRDDEGNYFYVGRRDDVITAGGYRISPLEVESVLNAHSQIEECAVVGHEETPGKTLIRAFIVASDSSGEKQDLIKDFSRFAAENLAEYKRPRDWVFVDALPKTRNGKILRRELTRPVLPSK